MAAFPSGHFYSPVIDVDELRGRRHELWPEETGEPAGIDLNLEGQRALLEKLRDLAREYPFPTAEQAPDLPPERFRDGNGFFENLDSRMLYCMLRHLSPRRLVEVGSGHSSLLSAEVNRGLLGSSIEITCIEPHPSEVLKAGLPGIHALIPEPVQAVGLDPFLRLEDGDVLFIDSSHVSKTGSDVNFLYLEVIPRLATGVVIHVHDIFLPEEYPEAWVLGEGRSWNEQYLLKALLMFPTAFEVLFGCHCAACFFPDQVADLFGGSFDGGSFWMRKAV